MGKMKKRLPGRVRKLNESWAGEDAIDRLFERVLAEMEDGNTPEDAIQNAIDDGLIYTSDIQTLASHYGVLPSDSELISLFQDKLFEDLYNRYLERAEEDVEDDEQFMENFNRVKRLIEKRGSKFEWDDDALVAELLQIKDMYKQQGERLADTPFEEIQAQFPEFAKWYLRYHSGMESNDRGNLDANSTPADEYWSLMQKPDFDAMFDYVKERAKQLPIWYYINHADWLKPFLRDDKE